MNDVELIGYTAYDPIHNIFYSLPRFEPEYLQAEYNKGIRFYANYANGRKEEIDPSNIKEIRREAKVNRIKMIQPSYVNERMSALLNIFEAFIDPLMLLLPSKYRTNIQNAINTFKELVSNTENDDT